MPRLMPEWCRDCGEIARLLRYLHDQDGLDIRDAFDIVEKPWNWDAEYQEMCRVQERPALAKCAEPNDEEDLSPLLQASLAVARGGRRR